MIYRQFIETELDLAGRPWRVTVARDFARSALLNQKLSDGQFFDFVSGQSGMVAFMAARKVKKHGLIGDKLTLDQTDFPV